MALTYFEISFSDVYWSKKAFVSINLSVFVEIILSESAESGNQDVFHCGAGSLVRGTSEDPYN